MQIPGNQRQKPLLNRSCLGYSIIEIMVALAILGLVGGGLIQGFLFMHRQTYHVRDHTAATDILRSMLSQVHTLPYSIDLGDGGQSVIPEILKTPEDEAVTTTPSPNSFTYQRATYTPRWRYNGTIYNDDGWAVLEGVPINIVADPTRADLTPEMATPWSTGTLRRRVTAMDTLQVTEADGTVSEIPHLRRIEFEIFTNTESMAGGEKPAIRIVTYRASTN
ncbi:MAG: type II secretion system protein J [Verrucomicrobiales bacterium]